MNGTLWVTASKTKFDSKFELDDHAINSYTQESKIELQESEYNDIDWRISNMIHIV